MTEVLVVGATGFLGGEICRRLAGAGHSVRALARREEDAAPLQSAGVSAAIGDLKDPPSLVDACQGVRAVITTATAIRSRREGDDLESVDLRGQLALVEAARSAGVQHFVYVSYSRNFTGGDPLTHAKRTVEQALRDSGMTFTVLRPSVFMEVWLSPALGFDFPNAKATVYGSGEQRISYVSLLDVARFAVEALVNPAARNAVIELGGPQALSPREVIGIFEEVSGRKFEVQHVPVEALRAQLAGASDQLSRTFASLTLAYAIGDPIDMSVTTRAFPGHLTSVREYAQRVLSQPAPQPVS